MLLLDTCTFLWWATGDAIISKELRTLLCDPAQAVFLSAVSAWEIAVKVKLNKLQLPVASSDYVSSRRIRLGIEPLPLDENDVGVLPKLPEIHKDPFDRMLVCQAIARGARIVTPDPLVQAYPCLTIWQ